MSILTVWFSFMVSSNPWHLMALHSL